MDGKNTQDAFASSIFSDESERFLCPPEPEPGQTVAVRLRGPKREDLSVWLVTGWGASLPMKRTDCGSRFFLFEAELICPREPVSYHFRIERAGRRWVFRKDGLREADRDGADPRADFRIAPLPVSPTAHRQ